MPHVTITPEVETVLRAARVEGNKLFLQGKLDRKLYEAVNKVLVNHGGKWSRSDAAHIFDRDPMVVLGLFAGDVVRDVKKDLQAFYTPAELARRVVQLASVAGKKVLEPSCGAGALIDACLEDGVAAVDAMEIDEKVADATRKKYSLPRVAILGGDFLNQRTMEPKFDRVVMNPPFAKSADIKHVAHAWAFLKPGGRLVSIMWPATHRPKFKELINRDDVESYEIIPVEEDAFKESGTSTATIILILDKKAS